MAERKLTFHHQILKDGFNTENWCEDEDDLGEVLEYIDYFKVYEELIERSLNNPSHCQHPLDMYKSLYGHAPNKCYICDSASFSTFRHCSFCNISVCLDCLKDPPPITINFPKSHEHDLTLLGRDVTFTCNACGLEGKRNPYVCLQCSFMVHKDCIYLPRVININRHDHRISRVAYLPLGNWECGVCRKSIDCAHGAFTCKRCPTYAVHSKCATREDVWDGKELEDEPEEEEIEAPFKVINETDIIHFSHDSHILRLRDEEEDASMRCDGCILSINDDPFYKCVECNFCLHIMCANLPRKKRHFLHNHKLTLVVDVEGEDMFPCSACKNMSQGFSYRCDETNDCNDVVFDIRCSSIAEPFHHELHQHPLYRTSTNAAICQGCNKSSDSVLSCLVCDFVLGMECATLPRKVKHKCDDHFLSLCQGVGNSNGDLWCDICEMKIDPSVWYYTCDVCGITPHVICVLGDLYYMNEGIYEGGDLEILSNNGASRPLCSYGDNRCRFLFSLKYTKEESVRYFCSAHCYFESYQ